MKDTNIETSLDALREFRNQLYAAFGSWSDSLFELVDSSLCSGQPLHSFPSLSLEPEFRRGHGSVYKALKHGEIDLEAVRDLLVEHLCPNDPLIFAVDGSTWARNEAETSPERGYCYSASKQLSGKP